MIPKTIHYCWFGYGEKSKEIEKYINGWKSILTDYSFKEWNEGNFDVKANLYVREAYEAKKWAFVTDYVRLYALYYEGGIYMDTDVELLKSLNFFLECRAFSGFEARESGLTAVMGAEKGMPIIRKLMNYYETNHFIGENGKYNLTTNTAITTEYLRKYGLKLNGKKQTIKDFTLFPQYYFCPNTFGMIFGKKPHKSYAIHHMHSSWTDEVRHIDLLSNTKHYIGGKVRNIIGTKRYAMIRKKKYL